jgi:hypothetical protein
MTELKNSDHAHVFILKLWQEVLKDEQDQKQLEWRGKIQDVFNGETHYFRDWPTIVKFISNIYPELETRRRRNARPKLERTNSVKRSLDQSLRRRVVAKD